MTQREEFLIAVEEFEDAVVAERDCAGGVPSFLTEKTAAARSRLLEIWDEQQAEVERREEALEMFRDEQKRDRAEVERLRDSVLTEEEAQAICADWDGLGWSHLRSAADKAIMRSAIKKIRRLSGSPREERSDV